MKIEIRSYVLITWIFLLLKQVIDLYKGSNENRNQIICFNYLNIIIIKTLIDIHKGSTETWNRIIFFNYLNIIIINTLIDIHKDSTETWTRIAGFRVLSADHYTIEPIIISYLLKNFLLSKQFIVLYTSSTEN